MFYLNTLRALTTATGGARIKLLTLNALCALIMAGAAVCALTLFVITANGAINAAAVAGLAAFAFGENPPALLIRLYCGAFATIALIFAVFCGGVCGEYVAKMAREFRLWRGAIKWEKSRAALAGMRAAFPVCDYCKRTAVNPVANGMDYTVCANCVNDSEFACEQGFNPPSEIHTARLNNAAANAARVCGAALIAGGSYAVCADISAAAYITAAAPLALYNPPMPPGNKIPNGAAGNIVANAVDKARTAYNDTHSARRADGVFFNALINPAKCANKKTRGALKEFARKCGRYTPAAIIGGGVITAFSLFAGVDITGIAIAGGAFALPKFAKSELPENPKAKDGTEMPPFVNAFRETAKMLNAFADYHITHGSLTFDNDYDDLCNITALMLHNCGFAVNGWQIGADWDGEGSPDNAAQKHHYLIAARLMRAVITGMTAAELREMMTREIPPLPNFDSEENRAVREFCEMEKGMIRAALYAEFAGAKGIGDTDGRIPAHYALSPKGAHGGGIWRKDGESLREFAARVGITLAGVFAAIGGAFAFATGGGFEFAAAALTGVVIPEHMRESVRESLRRVYKHGAAAEKLADDNAENSPANFGAQFNAISHNAECVCDGVETLAELLGFARLRTDVNAHKTPIGDYVGENEFGVNAQTGEKCGYSGDYPAHIANAVFAIRRAELIARHLCECGKDGDWNFPDYKDGGKGENLSVEEIAADYNAALTGALTAAIYAVNYDLLTDNGENTNCEFRAPMLNALRVLWRENKPALKSQTALIANAETMANAAVQGGAFNQIGDQRAAILNAAPLSQTARENDGARVCAPGEIPVNANELKALLKRLRELENDGGVNFNAAENAAAELENAAAELRAEINELAADCDGENADIADIAFELSGLIDNAQGGENAAENAQTGITAPDITPPEQAAKIPAVLLAIGGALLGGLSLCFDGGITALSIAAAGVITPARLVFAPIPENPALPCDNARDYAIAARAAYRGISRAGIGVIMRAPYFVNAAVKTALMRAIGIAKTAANNTAKAGDIIAYAVNSQSVNGINGVLSARKIGAYYQNAAAAVCAQFGVIRAARKLSLAWRDNPNDYANAHRAALITAADSARYYTRRARAADIIGEGVESDGDFANISAAPVRELADAAAAVVMAAYRRGHSDNYETLAAAYHRAFSPFAARELVKCERCDNPAAFGITPLCFNHGGI